MLRNGNNSSSLFIHKPPDISGSTWAPCLPFLFTNLPTFLVRHELQVFLFYSQTSRHFWFDMSSRSSLFIHKLSDISGSTWAPGLPFFYSQTSRHFWFEVSSRSSFFIHKPPDISGSTWAPGLPFFIHKPPDISGSTWAPVFILILKMVMASRTF